MLLRRSVEYIITFLRFVADLVKKILFKIFILNKMFLTRSEKYYKQIENNAFTF